MFQVYPSISDNTHSVETGICHLLYFPPYSPLCRLCSSLHLYVCALMDSCFLVIIGIVEWRKRHKTTKIPKVLLVGDPKSGKTSLINKVASIVVSKK